jgi:hypothetical protein
MKRREWLGSMGFLAGGLTLQHSVAGAAGHGANNAQASGPLGNAHAHFCGIHLAKNDPTFQLITQHYCTAHSDSHSPDAEAVFQCLLFDSTLPTAKLLGVEYIISDKQYRRLPPAEKQYWHPHTYEVLAGGLTAPEMGAEEEMEFMRQLLTTWGKTWHTWPDPTAAIPCGEPVLMWSAIADGQIDPEVIARRDRELGVSASKLRQRRGQVLGYEVPNVSFPKHPEQVGRQWTDQGPDAPKRLR